MKKYCIAFIFMLTCVYAQAQSTEQTVVNLSKKKFGWMVRMRFDSLQAILDDRLMFVHSNGWTETGHELVDDIKSGKLKYVSIDVSESLARVYPGTAIVTGKGRFQVLLDGKPLDINLYYTEVYILKNEKWFLASRHANRLP